MTKPISTARSPATAAPGRPACALDEANFMRLRILVRLTKVQCGMRGGCKRQRCRRSQTCAKVNEIYRECGPEIARQVEAREASEAQSRAGQASPPLKPFA